MTSIAGYTGHPFGEKTGILGESQHQFLLRVEANVERMEGLLNDLIKATTLDTGQTEPVPQRVDLADTSDSALDSLSAWFDEKRLSVQSDLSPHLPPVQADHDGLHQVVLNPASDAALASKPGTEIQLPGRGEQPNGVEELPLHLLVHITDAGGGNSREEQGHVLQRFYSADNSLIGGLCEAGVGLSVAKAPVEAHGGTDLSGERDGSG